jgi:hypothetical protein
MPSRYLVSPSEYDDIGAVLSEFGQGFEFDACSWEDLCRPRVIRGYEVVYLNCARQFEDAAFRARLAPVLRDFVNDGGTVYASDWALTVVCEAFPGRLGIDLGGEDGDFSCLVGDRGLQEFLGRDMNIHFDMPAWAMLQEIHPDVRVYVEARDLRRTSPRELRLPVVAGFQHGGGHVLATSFHNEHQLSARERRLLKFLALQPALAQRAHATSQIVRGRDAKVGAEFMETVNRGRFSEPMRFEGDGSPLLVFLNWQATARLRLIVQGPNGQILLDRVSESAPLGGELTGFGRGMIECRVEGVDVPYDNFPFVVTVATAKAAAPPPPPPPVRSGAGSAAPTPQPLVSPRLPPGVPPPPPPPPARPPAASTTASPKQPSAPSGQATRMPPPPPPPPPPRRN